MVTLCNPMTCGGFSAEIFGGCSMVWIAMVILFFIIVFARKWIGEASGIPFFAPGAFILGFLTLFIVSVLTCSYKFALVGGVVGAAIGAFLLGQFFGDGGGY